MAIEIKVPTVGESITSGLLGVWNKPDGAYVKVGDPIFEIETDKVTAEVVAESAGVLKHLAKAGDTVQIGQVVASIDEKAAAPAEAAPAAKKDEANARRRRRARRLPPRSPLRRAARMPMIFRPPSVTRRRKRGSIRPPLPARARMGAFSRAMFLRSKARRPLRRERAASTSPRWRLPRRNRPASAPRAGR